MLTRKITSQPPAFVSALRSVKSEKWAFELAGAGDADPPPPKDALHCQLSTVRVPSDHLRSTVPEFR